MRHLLKKLLRLRVRISSSGRTDPGMVRKQNEDAFCILDEGRLLLVADGMGGHNGGETASRLAIESLTTYFSPEMIARSFGNQQEARHLLITGLRLANEAVMKGAQADESLRGMGCTLLAGLIDHDLLHTCHVGDTRCYRSTTSGLRQITSDHATLTAYRRPRVGNGQAAERRVLTRAIGFPFHEDPEYSQTDLLAGDRLLFCSDGLWSMLSEAELQAILNEAPSAERAGDNLIEAANQAGGRDNITAVVVFV
jgi:PPM family protein phosphatase